MYRSYNSWREGRWRCATSQAIIYHFFYQKNGFNYIHTPLSEISHNDNNDEKWTETWENFFQFSNFSNVEIDEKIDFNPFKNSIDLIPTLIRNDKAETNQFYQLNDCHSYINRNLSCYEQIRPELRHHYESNERTPNLLYDKNILNVAIHVRREDIKEERNPERFTSAKKLK